MEKARSCVVHSRQFLEGDLLSGICKYTTANLKSPAGILLKIF